MAGIEAWEWSIHEQAMARKNFLVEVCRFRESEERLLELLAISELLSVSGRKTLAFRRGL